MKLPFIIILIYLIFQENSFPQTDWQKWEKAEISYQLPEENSRRDYSLSGDNPSEIITKAFTNAYWFFISDVDGDNCPFHPSCSEFFVEAVKETNIFQGTLMFFDRFIRDLNFYKRHEHYPKFENGHFYDPPEIYQLSKNKIHYIPSSVIAKDE